MQLFGIFLLFAVIALGFSSRNMTQVSAFDPHALVMVLVGCAAAVLLGSSSKTALRTLTCLREFIPGMRGFSSQTMKMDEEREKICVLWREGKKSQVLEFLDKSNFESTKLFVQLLLRRAAGASSEKVFTELRHDEIERMQPAIHNWEMLSKLGPSFGMVGTITGMIQLFKNMTSDNTNIGTAMSLALTATLYGVAFGAGIAGPISHYLNTLLDERIGMVERCQKSVNDLLAEG
ncbi:MAG: MotA/TolQ/ExbB proton channel family protein [Silvanigrellaceae bacterium]